MDHLLWDASSWNKHRCGQRWRELKKSVCFWASLESRGTSFFWQDSLAGCGIDQPLFGFSGIHLLCAFPIVACLNALWTEGRKEGTGRKSTWASNNHIEGRPPLYTPAQSRGHIQTSIEMFVNILAHVQKVNRVRTALQICLTGPVPPLLPLQAALCVTAIEVWLKGCEQPGPFILFPKCSEENPSSLLRFKRPCKI